jgi:hypothetical protein
MPFAIFIANVLLLIVHFNSNIYYIFSWQGFRSKGIWSIYVTGFTALVLVSTVVCLGSLRKMFGIMIIVDNIMLVFVVAFVALYGMCVIIDDGTWPTDVLQFGFFFQAFSINILFKLMML